MAPDEVTGEFGEAGGAPEAAAEVLVAVADAVGAVADAVGAGVGEPGEAIGPLHAETASIDEVPMSLRAARVVRARVVRPEWGVSLLSSRIIGIICAHVAMEPSENVDAEAVHAGRSGAVSGCLFPAGP
jgi:hypothetical protein